MTAVLPLKPLANAKSRLAPALENARPGLVEAMARDVLSAIADSEKLAEIIVVTSDTHLADIAKGHGACVLAEGEARDLNAAIVDGIELARRNGADVCVVLPGDIPLMTARDLDNLLTAYEEFRAAHGSRSVGILPCKQGTGTNLLCMSAEEPLAPQFGIGSYAVHKEAALRDGRQILELESESIALDIDVPADIEMLLRFFDAEENGLAQHTCRFLAGLSADQNETSKLLKRMELGHRLTRDEALRLGTDLPLPEMMQSAARLRDIHHGQIITFSKKVFLPLTHLCRDTCHYCVFAKAPSRIPEPYMSVEKALEIASEGAKLGCKEALFTLGDKPELRYRVAAEWLSANGFASTLHYVAHVAEQVLKKTGLLPHINAGCMSVEEIAFLRKVAPSMGLMLESVSPRLCEKGGPHYGSPDKQPEVRLQTMEDAGKANVPFTTGILIGIGETREEIVDSLLAIRDLNDRHGHIQEVIVQNFAPKPDTKMAGSPAASLDDLLWSIAMARLILGGEMSIQAPPNLSEGNLAHLIAAGINDWGGVSPLTPDHVNPEAPWPHLDDLAARTASEGKLLQERLTIYPAYGLDAARWVDPAVKRYVLPHMDSAGLAREEDWLTGLSTSIPDFYKNEKHRRGASRKVSGAISGLLEELQEFGARHLDAEDIVPLFEARGNDFHAICEAADDLRKSTCGDTVTYVINRNINYTNICTYRCTFCAFSKGHKNREGADPAYLLDYEEIARRSLESWDKGGTEVCLQGGIHPTFTGETYLKICDAVMNVTPEMHIHAFSPLEVTHGAQTLGLSLREFLAELKSRGLKSLPGTAAEILHDPVRDIICSDKIKTREWVEVIETAHELGIPTTSTIMFGHVETYRDWAIHLMELLRLQLRTGGITEFVPLPFVAGEAPMFLKGQARLGPTLRESILMHAVGRLVFHTAIRNIQASWVKMGLEGVQACLRAGANDLGGTLMNESITRAAGATHGQEMTADRLHETIRAIGREPAQRSTLYKKITSGRNRSLEAAGVFSSI